MLKQLRKIKEEIVYARNNYKTDMFNSAGIAISTLIGVVGLIYSVVSCVMYYSNGNYSEHVALINDKGIDGIQSAMTFSDLSVFANKATMMFVCILLIVECAILLISFYKTVPVWKKILISVLVVLSVALVVSGVVWALIVNSKIVLSMEQTEQFVALYQRVGADNLELMYFGAWLVILAVISILFITSECKRSAKHFLRMIVLTFVIMPITVFVLKNVLLLGFGIGYLILIALVFIVLAWFLVGALGNTGSASHERAYSQGSSKNNVNGKKLDTNNANAKQPKHWKIERKAKLWVESNATGTKVIRAYGQGAFSAEYKDPIYFALMVEPTLHEFLNGEVIITVQGKRMNERDLNYK